KLLVGATASGSAAPARNETIASQTNRGIADRLQFIESFLLKVSGGGRATGGRPPSAARPFCLSYPTRPPAVFPCSQPGCCRRAAAPPKSERRRSLPTPLCR